MRGLDGEDAVEVGQRALRGILRARDVAERLISLDDHAQRSVALGIEFSGPLEMPDRVGILPRRQTAIAGNHVGLEAFRVERQRDVRLLHASREVIAPDQRFGESGARFGKIRVDLDRVLRGAPPVIVGQVVLRHLALRRRHQCPGAGEFGIELHRLAAYAHDDRLHPLAASAAELARQQEEFIGLRARGHPLLQRFLLGWREFEFQRGNDRLADLVLNGEDVVERPVEPIGPDLRIARCFDQLCGQPHPIARTAHAAFEDVRDIEVARQRRCRNGAALVGEGGVARDDRERRDPAQIGDDVLGDAVGEILLFLVAAHVDEWQDQDCGLGRPAARRRSLKRSRQACLRRLAALDQSAQVGKDSEPGPVIGCALPVRQVGRLGQFEHDRPVAGLDHHRQQRLVAVRQRRLGPNPARLHRRLRPQHEHRPGLFQRLLGDLVIGLPAAQRRVPPDLEALRGQRLGIAPRNRLVLTAVGKEDIRHKRPFCCASDRRALQAISQSIGEVDARRDAKRQAARLSPSCAQIATSAVINSSIIASVWSGDGVKRRRSAPLGTVG